MRQLIKNFFHSLRRSLSQVIGLVVALIVLISLFTGFWLSANFGYEQIAKIEGPYLDSMLVNSDEAELNSGIWKNISFVPPADSRDAHTALINYFQHATIGLQTEGGVNHYAATLFDPQHGIFLGQRRLIPQLTAVTYNFQNPFFNNRDDANYVDFKQLITRINDSPLQLLPSLTMSDNKNLVDYIMTNDPNYGTSLLKQFYQIFTGQPWSDTTRFTFIDACNYSKRIIQQIILGMNGTDFKLAEYFTYNDPVQQFSVLAFPQIINSALPYYSNPVAEGDNSVLLKSNEILLTKNFAIDNHINIGDWMMVQGKNYLVRGFAVNAIYNSHIGGGSFKYTPGIWFNASTYQDVLANSRIASGFVHNNDVYFEATSLAVTNPQLFGNNQSEINMNLDPTGDLYYANQMLSLFLRQVTNPLDNYYYKIPAPTGNGDENMGVHSQLNAINRRNDLLFNVLLTASAVLEVASIIMVIVVISSLIKNSQQSLGVLKANGMSSIQIAFSVSVCFLALLVVTGVLAIIFSILIGYVMNLTYEGFTQMTNYTFMFVWYIAVIDFFLPVLLIIPFVLLFAYLNVRRAPLLLIYGGSGDKRFTFIHFTKNLDWFKIIKRVDLNFKHKLSMKFAFDARGKLVLTIIVALISSIMIYLSFNLLATNKQMYNDTAQNFYANQIYGFSNQPVRNATQNNKYVFLDKQNFDFNNSGPQKLINPSNQLAYTVQELSLKNLMDYHNADTLYWVKAITVQQFFENPHHPTGKWDDLYNANKQLIAQMAKPENNGVFTIGFELYDSRSEQLMLSKTIGVFELANKQAKSITLFNHNKDNWINRQIIDKFIKNNNLLADKNATLVSRNDYNEQSYLKLKLNHYSTTQFLNAPIDGYITDPIHPDVSAQLALADGDPAVVNSLRLIQNQLIPDWIQMGISRINVIPIAVNRFYDITGASSIGDILYSNQTNNGFLNVYVIYDWLNSLNSSFMVVPERCLANNLIKEQVHTHPNEQPIYNWKLSTLNKPDFFQELAIINDQGDYSNLLNPDLSFHINLNFTMARAMLLQLISDTNQGFLTIIEIIGVIAFVVTIAQVGVTMNVILKSNLRMINLFKALGYTRIWIFNRIFIIYIPLIIISGLLSFPFGYLVSYFTFKEVIQMSLMYTPFIINFPNIVYITLVILALFFVILVIMSAINSRRYPVYRLVTN